MDIDGYRFKRDVLFCYDLKLPESFIPKNGGKALETLLSTGVNLLINNWILLLILHFMFLKIVFNLICCFLEGEVHPLEWLI